MRMLKALVTDGMKSEGQKIENNQHRRERLFTMPEIMFNVVPIISIVVKLPKAVEGLFAFSS